MEEKRKKTVERLYKLLDLQKNLENEFGDKDYNVFIFGSYLTVEYQEGVSDIDIAIYTCDFNLYKKIAIYINNYFNEQNIPSDIFYIDINMIAPIYLAPLKSEVHLTDYFPKTLQNFVEQCEEHLKTIKMELII